MTAQDPLTDSAARVAVFAPTPLLTITIENQGAGRAGTDPAVDEIHVHAGGQGIWVARMAATLGAAPVLCSLIGGESGTVIEPLLGELPAELRLVRSPGATGCYVTDRREGERRLVAAALPEAAGRHEVDDLFSVTTAAALGARVLVVCNAYPGDVLPLDIYGKLVEDARENGVAVIVDLSSPRLEGALAAQPDLAKVNDWELAGFVRGPVDTPARLRAAAERMLEDGARAAIVTRGPDPALLVRDGSAVELAPPRFERGSREGCGDSMMGGVAAGLAAGLPIDEALVLGAGAGAANFLRHGLGTGSRSVVEELAGRVEVRELS
jgi:1-phosphofructokinase